MSSTTSTALPTPTATSLGFGMIPKYPKSLLLSENVAVNCLLADIPFFIIGILGFALITFFIAVRQMNKFVPLIALAVFLDFLGALLDLTQLLQRGRFVQVGTDVTSFKGIIIVREVFFSLAPGVFFLFYWFFVALPPRGELERPYGGRSFSRALGIVDYRGAYHSGRWDRWGLVGKGLQWSLLAAVTAVPILQAAWRTTEFTVSFSGLYNASATLQIILSSLFVLKLLGNTWMAVNLPQGRTIRDYIPILASLLVSLGVSIGDTIVFKFSETVLGRFLQAVQGYTIILYALIATFYRASFDDTPLPSPPKASTPFDGIGVNINPSTSTFNVVPPNVSTPDLENAIRSNRRTSYYRGSSRSTITRLSSWLNRGLSTSNREAADAPGTQDDESDILPITDRKEKDPTDYDDDASSGSFVEVKEKRAAPPTKPSIALSVPLTQRAAKPPEIPFSSTSSATPLASRAFEDQSRDFEQSALQPPSLNRDSSTGSPVYGLRGRMGDDEKASSRSSKDSELSSLLRQQAELDKSVAGLQVYSEGADRASRLTIAVSPTQSDFSLSRFPEPPFALNDNRRSDISNSISGDDFVVDDVEFTLVPPQMPAATSVRNSSGGRQTSFPLSSRGSEVNSILTKGRNPMYDSNGTQYDVTSFIGGLTTPSATTNGPAPSTLSKALATIPSDDEGLDAALSDPRPAPVPPVSSNALNVVTLLSNPRPVVASDRSPQTLLPQPLLLRTGIQTIEPQTEPQTLSSIKKSNLRRPKISAPLARISIEQPAAYERPRQPPAAVPPSSFKQT